MENLLPNNVGHDQTQHYVASDLRLHCLPMTLYMFPGKNRLSLTSSINTKRAAINDLFTETCIEETLLNDPNLTFSEEEAKVDENALQTTTIVKQEMGEDNIDNNEEMLKEITLEGADIIFLRTTETIRI